MIRQITFLLVVITTASAIKLNGYPRMRQDLMDYPDPKNDLNDYSLNEPDLVREAVESDKKQNSIEGADIPLGIPDAEENVPGEPLTPEDFANAEKVEFQAPVMNENSPDPLFSAGLFEGDIAGIDLANFESRNAIVDMNKKWPEGIVPYVISAEFNSFERSVIAAALADYHKFTCIRFIPRTYHKDYVYLFKGRGCYSFVGRQGGGQKVSLDNGCVIRHTVFHELMHAVGFWHEQSRPDRDDYITILWQNIKEGQHTNFMKYNWNQAQSLGVPYDMNSVMHYSSLGFSKDGVSPTILPKKPGMVVGPRGNFTHNDIAKLNRLYKCEVKPPVVKPPKPETGCVNHHKYCDFWSGIGECSKNPNYMLVNCKKACLQCKESCQNYNPNCKYWASIGECKANPFYMVLYCPKSCRVCQ